MNKIDFSKSGISENELQAIEPEIRKSFTKILGRQSDMLGWLDLPSRLSDDSELERILALAREIRATSRPLTLLFIGIGGSYLGARSFIEAIGASEGVCVLFAGKDMSNRELQATYKAAAKADNLYIVVISKSGTTMEPAFAFQIFEKMIHEKYVDANRRIFAITDANQGVLHDTARQKGYETFAVPDNIGGRYSLLTPVGTLPITLACGETVTRELINGALKAEQDLSNPDFAGNAAMRYAGLRYIMGQSRQVELLASFEPSLAYLAEWWKQLFGESEGKNGRGLWPSSVIYSTDLHSLGQFVQDGSPILFETFLEFAKIPNEDDLPLIDAAPVLAFLEGKNLAYVQRATIEATKSAHAEGNTPNLSLILEDFSAHSLGYFYYFMMLSCAISAYTLGVNPFDQPGVEAYKKKMFESLA